MGAHCGCMEEDLNDGLGERVVIHSRRCPFHPDAEVAPKPALRSADLAAGLCEVDGCARLSRYTFGATSPYPDATGSHRREISTCSPEHAELEAESLWGIGYDFDIR